MALPEITQKCIEILEMRGQIVRFNDVFVGRIYEDDKLEIACTLVPDDEKPGKWMVVELTIDLKLSGSGSTPAGFENPKEDMTRVYAWDRYEFKGDVPVFARPGKWVEYVRALHTDVENQAAALINTKSVDDASLFG